MSRIVDYAPKTKLRQLIQGLASNADAGIPRAFAEALQSLLAGMDYNDPALVQSSFASAMLTFADAVDEAIKSRLGWPQSARENCRQIWDLMRQAPIENMDEAGSDIESYFDEMLRVLTDLRDGPVKVLTGKGYAIKNAAQLESDIKELNDLKRDVFHSWPWSNRELPPVDLVMLDASMSAFAGGERGQRIEDLIASFDGTISLGN